MTTASDRGSGASTRIGGGVQVNRPTEPIHRTLRDSAGNYVFAYDLLVTETGYQRYRIETAPISPEYERTLHAPGPIPTIQSRGEAVSLGMGERAQIALLINPQTGEKISDVLEVVSNAGFGAGFGSGVGANSKSSSSSSAGGASSGSGTGRGVGVGFGWEHDLQLWGVTVTRNGQTIASSTPGSSVMGKTLMIYIPEYGGFFFAPTQPSQPGFLKVGIIDGTRLKFTWNNDNYEIASGRPIRADAPSGELWVYHDPTFKPRPIRIGSAQPPPDATQFGSASDVSAWFKKPE
jgi:hypothetical protein